MSQSNFRILFSLAAMLGLLLNSQVLAQEEVETEGGVEQVEMAVIASDDGSPPMIFSSGPTGMAFSNGGAFTMIGGGDFAMPAPDPWSMINNPSVQKDLELVGDQLDKLKDLQRRQSEEMRKNIQPMKNGKIDMANIEAMKETMEKLRSQHRDELKGMLLPHQIERLEQVALQTHMRQAGTANALASKQVAEALGIDEDQVKRLKEKAKELNEKLAKKMEELKDQTQKELLMELTPQQRQKLEAMVGDKYKPNDQDWKEQFQQRIQNRRRSVKSGSEGSRD